MPTERLLFARPSGTATLAPIYAALVALVAVSLLGLGIAFWIAPSEPHAAQRRSHTMPANSPAISDRDSESVRR